LIAASGEGFSHTNFRKGAIASSQRWSRGCRKQDNGSQANAR